MTVFPDSEFDVVFSNSVIEHLGTYEDQWKMAEEVRRVGQRYFVQTPNKYFPIEPHFLVPFCQFFPTALRAWLLTRFDLGWHKRAANYKTARRLFPEANLYKERVWGLTKSFIVYHGWAGNSKICCKKNRKETLKC